MGIKLLLVGGVLALAACGGGGGSKTDLPAGQHDLGHDVTVVFHGMKPLPNKPTEAGTHVVAVDLEYFNHGDQPADTTWGYAVNLTTQDNREATGLWVDMPDIAKTIPPGRASRGWKAFQVPNGDKPAMLALWGDANDGKPKEVVIDL